MAYDRFLSALRAIHTATGAIEVQTLAEELAAVRREL
jgi:hypothetical protein